MQTDKLCFILDLMNGKTHFIRPTTSHTPLHKQITHTPIYLSAFSLRDHSLILLSFDLILSGSVWVCICSCCTYVRVCGCRVWVCVVWFCCVCCLCVVFWFFCVCVCVVVCVCVFVCVCVCQA